MNLAMWMSKPKEPSWDDWDKVVAICYTREVGHLLVKERDERVVPYTGRAIGNTLHGGIRYVQRDQKAVEFCKCSSQGMTNLIDRDGEETLSLTGRWPRTKVTLFVLWLLIKVRTSSNI